MQWPRGTHYNCFPPPGREGEDPSRLISMVMIKGKFFKERHSYCVMIAFTYFRETNKMRLSRQITKGSDIPTRMAYPFLIPTMASEGA